MKSQAPMRLNRFIAQAGICSRRKADELIESGLIRVNGKKVFELGRKIDPENDSVIYRNKKVQLKDENICYALHKPRQVLSTMDDPEDRPCLTDLIDKKIKVRLFPIGRLDWDSEGLILLTDSGNLSQKIAHPSSKVVKTYLIKIDRPLNQDRIDKLLRGVTIPGGKAKAEFVLPQKGTVRGGQKTKHYWYKIGITEGRNRQIRKMLEKVHRDVLRLKRTSIGGLRLGTLKSGHMKQLDNTDIQKIFKKFEGKPSS